MAYTKILVIHDRLDKSVNYAQNPDKTSLETALDYALNRAKTEQTCFETAVNCDRAAVYADMMATKMRWNKAGRKRKGYHIIQSFAPGEVTPEQAHAAGVELAQRLLGDRYEVIVSTHLDKAHLHNHIVFNSVSFVDGAMYRDTKADYYQGIRGTSDAICREQGLSVIAPEGKGRQYSAWEAEQDGRPTVRGTLARYKSQKLTGFQALCFKYLYLLRRTKRGRPVSRTAFDMRRELIRFDRCQRQFLYLHKNRIETQAQLSMQYDAIQAGIDALTDRRRDLYKLRRAGDDTMTAEIEAITQQLRPLRRELKLCVQIEKDSSRMKEAVREAEEQRSKARTRLTKTKSRKQEVK